jgi:hypothetical protein
MVAGLKELRPTTVDNELDEEIIFAKLPLSLK